VLFLRRVSKQRELQEKRKEKLRTGERILSAASRHLPAPGNQTDGEQKKSKADEPFTSKYSLAACQCRNANILVFCLLVLLSANQQEIFSAVTYKD